MNNFTLFKDIKLIRKNIINGGKIIILSYVLGDRAVLRHMYLCLDISTDT